MVGVGYACAILLAAIFVQAAVAKAVHPTATAAGFAALGIPAAPAMARIVPAAELLLAVALLAAPRIGGIAALVVLAAFSGFLAQALRSGVTAGCNCFGQARAEPLSGADLERNGLLGLLGLGALLATRPGELGFGDVGIVMAAVAAGAVGLRWTRARRRRRADI